jgi:hypothetical protein
LVAENINISFLEPNIIRINAGQIGGFGKFDVRFKAGFISEADNVNVNANRIDCQDDIVLIQTESSIPGKFLPSGFVQDISPVFDFDFDNHNSVIAGIVDIVMSLIKNTIRDNIIKPLFLISNQLLLKPLKKR